MKALLDLAKQRLLHADPRGALRILDEAKARRVPAMGLDLLRATAFVHQRDLLQARQALFEELRLFPSNAEARRLSLQIEWEMREYLKVPAEIETEEPVFAMLWAALQPFTMLPLWRLFSLYTHAKSLSQAKVLGDVVECGSAGGGSAVLMAVTSRFFGVERRVFACDTFSGMPAPSELDVISSSQQHASVTGWGAGTCAGSVEALERVACNFGVTVTPVPGLFADTLPSLPSGDIALLHIDADWYESTLCALRNLFHRVKPGVGVIQIDDYGYWDGCTKATDEFLRCPEVDLEPTRVLHRIDPNAAWMVRPMPPA